MKKILYIVCKPGFTLVEVMVALVIIAIAIVTLLATHVMSTRNYAESWTTTISSMLAQQMLTELRLLEELPEPGEQSGTFENNDKYRWYLKVEETDVENLVKVTLDVSLAPPEETEEAPILGGVVVETYLAKLAEEEEEEEEEVAY